MAAAARNQRDTAAPSTFAGSVAFCRLPAACCLIAALSVIAPLAADEPATSTPTAAADANPLTADREQARATAVALNYCRTSFHRIRSYPSKRVLLEEQQKILNNLNLNGIADEEVVKLYTAVLAEIGGVQIAERERIVIKEQHRRVFYRQLSLTALDLTAQLATAHYADAVRTGAASWWDFRAMGWQTELDSWRLEKEQLLALTDKSALFLDTFWKLARRRDIPDRWLVRSADLDRLDAAVREPDLAVRLRILKRMENFMECYPPYWYYVGRTQQQLGQLFAAADTYRTLGELGTGHFRKDEMLAAGTVNRAIIQQFLKQPSADETARQALRYSNDDWEVNLLGADVLRRHEQYDEAEDAILRNLDDDLERPQSLAALLGLYYDWKQKEKLAAQLASLDVIREVPLPVLLQTARLFADEKLPAPLAAHLRASIVGQAELRFGRDDLVFTALPAWQLPAARASLSAGREICEKPEQADVREHRELRFRRALELGTPLKPSTEEPPLNLALEYPHGLRLHLHLERGPAAENIDDPSAPRGDHLYRLTRIDVNDTPLRLTAAVVPLAVPPVPGDAGQSPR